MLKRWIGYISDAHCAEIEKYDTFGCVAQYYRKRFSLKEKPVKATIEISALGIFSVFVNGKKASEEYFAPGWTTYGKRILLREYDITPLLDENNAISVCVGEGWYCGYLSIKGRNVYGEPPHSIVAEITVTYADDSTEKIVTDESWLAGTGAIRENDFLGGEIYDARLCHKETSLYDFDDREWNNVSLTEDFSERLTKIYYEPVILQETFPAKIVSSNGRKTVYDIGQNLAGVVTVRAKGPAGAKLTIRHGEMLDSDGEVYTENLRCAKATDTLILGNEEIEYTPTMTYHGFRYFDIVADEGVEIISVCARALYNDLKKTGEVQTSNALVNQLLSNITWGMKSNFVDLPTDCPQRNERLGWSGDTQVFSRSAMYLADCRRFYEKHLLCLNDDRKDGLIPSMVPFFGVSQYDALGWRDVAVVLPFNLWEMYGDVAKAKEQVPMINDFIGHILDTREDGIWTKSFYNDWLNVDEDVHPAVLATLCSAYCVMLTCKLYKDIGEACDVYEKEFLAIKRAFLEKFVDETGRIEGETLTAYAMAYVNGFISADVAKEGCLRALAAKNNHIHSGFLGLRFILPVLCEVGLVDMAYELLTKKTYPSWGYSIENGATTIWERWDSYTIEKGFQDKGMNSFNHYSLGSCGEWFYEYGLGIKPIVAGFTKTQIKPYVDRSGKIDHMSGSFDSVNGKISVSWYREKGYYVCEIEKPSEMYAEFVFDNVMQIEQDGRNAEKFDPYATKTTVYFK